LENKGYTLIELMISIAIVAILAAIALPNFINYVYKAKVAQAIAEIRMLEKVIWNFELDNGTLPDSLGDIQYFDFRDPWGRPYQYLNIAGMTKGKGEKKGIEKPRKDRFLVPVNSDYDLYSMGRDGKSVAPFTAKASRDDIVRANDGAFVGFASEY